MTSKRVLRGAMHVGLGAGAAVLFSVLGSQTADAAPMRIPDAPSKPAVKPATPAEIQKQDAADKRATQANNRPATPAKPQVAVKGRDTGPTPERAAAQAKDRRDAKADKQPDKQPDKSNNDKKPSNYKNNNNNDNKDDNKDKGGKDKPGDAKAETKKLVYGTPMGVRHTTLSTAEVTGDDGKKDLDACFTNGCDTKAEGKAGGKKITAEVTRSPGSSKPTQKITAEGSRTVETLQNQGEGGSVTRDGNGTLQGKCGPQACDNEGSTQKKSGGKKKPTTKQLKVSGKSTMRVGQDKIEADCDDSCESSGSNKSGEAKSKLDGGGKTELTDDKISTKPTNKTQRQESRLGSNRASVTGGRGGTSVEGKTAVATCDECTDHEAANDDTGAFASGKSEGSRHSHGTSRVKGDRAYLSHRTEGGRGSGVAKDGKGSIATADCSGGSCDFVATAGPGRARVTQSGKNNDNFSRSVTANGKTLTGGGTQAGWHKGRTEIDGDGELSYQEFDPRRDGAGAPHPDAVFQRPVLNRRGQVSTMTARPTGPTGSGAARLANGSTVEWDTPADILTPPPGRTDSPGGNPGKDPVSGTNDYGLDESSRAIANDRTAAAALPGYIADPDTDRLDPASSAVAGTSVDIDTSIAAALAAKAKTYDPSGREPHLNLSERSAGRVSATIDAVGDTLREGTPAQQSWLRANGGNPGAIARALKSAAATPEWDAYQGPFTERLNPLHDATVGRERDYEAGVRADRADPRRWAGDFAKANPHLVKTVEEMTVGAYTVDELNGRLPLRLAPGVLDEQLDRTDLSPAEKKKMHDQLLMRAVTEDPGQQGFLDGVDEQFNGAPPVTTPEVPLELRGNLGQIASDTAYNLGKGIPGGVGAAVREVGNRFEDGGYVVRSAVSPIADGEWQWHYAPRWNTQVDAQGQPVENTWEKIVRNLPFSAGIVNGVGKTAANFVNDDVRAGRKNFFDGWNIQAPWQSQEYHTDPGAALANDIGTVLLFAPGPKGAKGAAAQKTSSSLVLPKTPAGFTRTPSGLYVPDAVAGATRTPSGLYVPESPAGYTPNPSGLHMPDAVAGATRTPSGLHVPDAPTGFTRTPSGLYVPESAATKPPSSPWKVDGPKDGRLVTLSRPYERGKKTEWTSEGGAWKASGQGLAGEINASAAVKGTPGELNPKGTTTKPVGLEVKADGSLGPKASLEYQGSTVNAKLDGSLGARGESGLTINKNGVDFSVEGLIGARLQGRAQSNLGRLAPGVTFELRGGLVGAAKAGWGRRPDGSWGVRAWEGYVGFGKAKTGYDLGSKPGSRAKVPTGKAGRMQKRLTRSELAGQNQPDPIGTRPITAVGPGSVAPVPVEVADAIVVLGEVAGSDNVNGQLTGGSTTLGAAGDPQAMIALDNLGAGTACTVQQLINDKECGGLPILRVPADRIPYIARNTRLAWEENHPGILTMNRPMTKKNRSAACGTFTKTMSDGSCDEYPMAATDEGGAGARTEEVPKRENNVQGGLNRNQYPADAKRFIVVITKPEQMAKGIYGSTP